MNVSIRIFGFPLAEYAPLARAVDEAGFHGIFVPDHVLSMMDLEAAYPYSATGRPSFQGATPFADPLVMLSHLAAVTSRVRLGVGIYVLPMRHPLHAARQIMSVQQLSGGRFDLGVGVGWAREEFEALGAVFERRGGRAQEMVRVMRGVWSGEPTAFDGEHYRHAAVQMSPPIGHDVPILWGGSSDASVRRAVRMASGLYSPPGDLEATLGLRDRIRAGLAEAGRDESGFRFVVRCPEPGTGAEVALLRDQGLDDVVVNVPRELESAGAHAAWVADLAEELARLGIDLSGSDALASVNHKNDNHRTDLV